LSDSEQQTLAQVLTNIVQPTLVAANGASSTPAVITEVVGHERISMPETEYMRIDITVTVDHSFYEVVGDSVSSSISSTSFFDELRSESQIYVFASSASNLVPPRVDLGSMCDLCDSNCLTCSGGQATDCVSCSSDAVFLTIRNGDTYMNGQCLSECPVGMFSDESDGARCKPDECAAGRYLEDEASYAAPIVLTADSGAEVTSNSDWQYLQRAEIASVAPGTGQLGTLITVTGARLLSGGTNSGNISLGSANVHEIVSVSDSEIVVRVGAQPAGPSTFFIESDTGARFYSPEAFTYLEEGYINAIFPASGQYGTKVTISGSQLYGIGSSVDSVEFVGTPVHLVEHENSAVIEVVADHPAGRLGPIPTDGLSGAVTITSNTGDIVSTENGWTYLPAGHIYSVYPNSGQLGTRVGITGVRLFGGGNSIERIYLAGTLADISVATDTLAIVLANAADESAEPGDAMLVSDTGAVVTTDGIAFTYVPRAEISAINPTSGHFGTRFTITGEGMRAGGDIFISVTLASVEAREVVGTDTVITAVAGSSARRTGDVVITMDTGATTTLVNGWSYVNAGFIQNVRPDSGHGGTQVTISGQYLLGGGSEIASLPLAGAEVDSINDFSEGVIRAVAQPHAAIRGDVRIVMSTGAVINQIDGWTYVPEISIGTLAPASGQHGTIVTIPGAGMLGGGASIDSVTLSGVEVEEIRTNDRDDVIVVVAAESPGDGLTSGSVVITANTGATATLENAFTYVVAGSVDRIDPNSGQFGTRVEVHGSSFYGGGSSVVSVFFGDTDTTIISETDSIVVIGIPATAELGSVDVLIVSDNGARTLEVSGWTFLETGNIELVSPSSGQGSAIVTITGTGLFGGGAQVASVHLAEVEARILGESDTEIVVVVAAHPIAATGSVRILMDSGALIERVDGWSYVTPGVVSSVVPAIGQIGTQVTINGAGLMSGASSLVMVTLASETVGSIVSNTNSMVVIIASASSGAKTGDVVLIASTGAVVTSGNAWEYIQTGEIQSVSPAQGQIGTMVVISGERLRGASRCVRNRDAGIPAGDHHVPEQHRDPS